MWAISQALWCLVPGIIAALVASAAFQLRRGRPFAPDLARFATATAVTATLGGVSAQVLGDLAGAAAAVQLLGWTSSVTPTDIPGVDDVLAAWLPQPGFEITVPFWPIAAGLASAALAAILRYGSRLQRDTEGLV